MGYFAYIRPRKFTVSSAKQLTVLIQCMPYTSVIYTLQVCMYIYEMYNL